MLLIALLALGLVGLLAYAARSTPEPAISNEAIARSLGRLVRDGAVVVEAGLVHATAAAAERDRKLRGPLEARTLATVRVSGSIPLDRLFAAVKESRL